MDLTERACLGAPFLFRGAVMRRIPLPPKLIAAGLRLYRRTEQAELGLIAAGVAFFGFLAIFPAVAALITIWGIAFDPMMIRTQVELLRPVLPTEALKLVEAQVDALLQVKGASLGWATFLSTLLAIWSARAGVAALIRGLNAIYHRPNRGGAFHQLQALLLTAILVGLALAAMFFEVVAPLIIAALPLSGTDASWLHRVNLVLGFVLVVLSISLTYRFGPTHGPIRPRFLSWGLLVAVVLWILAARGFMIYLVNFPTYNRIYGSIGAVVVLMMWLYVSAYAVLLGAAVDAEHSRHRGTYL
jgi:membrane protein